MEQARMWNSQPDEVRVNITRTSTGSRRILTGLIIVVILAVIALLGWRLATRAKVVHLAATGSVLSVNPAAETFLVQFAGPKLTSNGATSVKISRSTVFQICRGNPVAPGAASRGCSPASSTAVKVGEQVRVVATGSSNTFTATRVQVL